jgi:hypothetical protein
LPESGIDGGLAIADLPEQVFKLSRFRGDRHPLKC